MLAATFENQGAWLTLLLLAVATLALTSRRRKSPYPPGPKQLPFLGNLFDLPNGKEWETYAKWAKELDSDIIHVNLAGTNVIVLNSLQSAVDLLDRRSGKYSSRAHFVMANELAGWGWLPGTMPYGRSWRARRRLFQRHFDPSDPSLYLHWQLHHGRMLLERILDAPEDIWDHMHHMVSGAIISIAYGIDVKSKDDPFVKLAVKGSESLINTLVPGKYLVDTLPFLKHVPDWFPGAGFKREAKEFKILTNRFREEPFLATVDAMDKGIAQPSFVSQCLQALSDNYHESHEEKEEERAAIIDMAANIYLGGADTTLSGIGTLLLVLVCYPEVQKKAQEEMDRVLGHGRLPEPSDKELLPYLNAVVMEVLRWRPATPIGVPHYSTEDDEYRGYYIPKNSLVIGNAWAMLHDEDVYSDPEKFNPDRFMTEDGKLNRDVRDPSLAAFGFGRRECPGQHVGISATWLIAAYLVSAFNLEKPMDPVIGEITEPSMEYHSGIVYSPLQFKMKVTPRSDKTIEMIRLLGQ